MTHDLRRSVIATARAGVLAVLLGACSSGPATFGDQLKAQSASLNSLGDKWNDGNSMEKEGQDLIRKGREQLAEAQGNIAKGEQLVQQGQLSRTEAEQSYQKRTTTGSTQ